MAGHPVTGRSCGKCNLCCKLLIIRELGKPDGVWCEHCEIGKGCRIHPERPAECRDFDCHYIYEPGLGEEWNPIRCHMLLRANSTDLVVQVDPQRPDAWKREPHHGMLRQLAQRLYPQGKRLFVKIGDRAFAILPDRDVDLGICAEGDRVECSPRFTPSGVRWDAVKVVKS